MSLWRWMLRGSDVQYLGTRWLQDKARMGNYVGYTRRQCQQGAVVKDNATIAKERDEAHAEALRMQFWARQAAKTEARRLKVVGGRFQ